MAVNVSAVLWNLRSCQLNKYVSLMFNCQYLIQLGETGLTYHN